MKRAHRGEAPDMGTFESCPGHTSIEEAPREALSARSTLGPSSPNSFNGGTAHRLELSRRSRVELPIYDLAGQKLTVLAQGLPEAGKHALLWDGRAARGHALASGVYRWRLQADGASAQTRKTALLKQEAVIRHGKADR